MLFLLIVLILILLLLIIILLLLLKVVVVVLVLLLIVIIIIGIFGRLVCLAPRTQNDLCSNGGKKEVLGGSLLTGYFTDFHK